MMQHPPVDAVAVVLNYRNAASTIDVAEAVLAGTRVPRVLVLLDNNSEDGSLPVLETWAAGHGRRLAQEGVSLVVRRLPRNDGYGAGNNEGLRFAVSVGAAWGWILNHDARPAPTALEQMWRATELADVAVVGATILNEDGSLQCVGGASYHPVLTRTRLLGPEDFAQRSPHSLYAPPQLSYVAGCCLLVRVRALEDVGFLEETYFLFFEEIDAMRRLASRGWRAAVVLEARVHHHRGLASGGRTALEDKSMAASYYGTRASLLFARRHHPATLVPAVLMRLSYSLSLNLRGHSALGRGVRRGITDALLGRRGPRPDRALSAR